MNKSKAIVAYQGGKVNLAGKIIDNIKLDNDKNFYDLCCGTGSISIELVRRGFSKDNIIMVDAGPWGLFWEKIGNGTFDMDVFLKYINMIPKDLYKVKDFMKELSKQDSDIDTAEVFILLQSASFGGKAIYIKDGKWKDSSFRGYWKPTKTSHRGSPVKPMVSPDRLVERLINVKESMYGITGIYDYIENIDIVNDSIVYIDPPYVGTTKYGFELDYLEFAERNKNKADIYISEGKPLGDSAVQISKVRPKGGISGSRKKQHEEWLTKY